MLDPQLKRGLLDHCVLAALCRGDSYGYQIIKDLSGSVALSESTLYPILRRLEQGGALSSYSVEHNGRLRKYYQITPEGEQKVRDFLEGWEQLRLIYAFIRKEFGYEPE